MQIETKDLITALRRMGVQTGGLMCVGCGYEHNCGIHGCALIKAAADKIETLGATIDVGTESVI